MTNELKERIIKLRSEGKSYGEIAKLTNLSKNTVATILRRQSIKTSCNCPVCGKTLKQTPGHRQKKFCSDECRMKYWRNHKDELNLKTFYKCVVNVN